MKWYDKYTSKIKCLLVLIFGSAILVVSAMVLSCTNKGSLAENDSYVTNRESNHTISELPEGLLIVDVRTPEEYANGHLVGAILLPHETATEFLTRIVPDRSTPIALYCRSGRRSGIVLEEMRKLDYVRVENWGGFEELVKKHAFVRPSGE